PLLELDAVAVRAEVPVPARHHAVEGGLHGTAGGQLEVHALVATAITEDGGHLLVVVEGRVAQALLELAAVGLVAAGVGVTLGVAAVGGEGLAVAIARVA